MKRVYRINNFHFFILIAFIGLIIYSVIAKFDSFSTDTGFDFPLLISIGFIALFIITLITYRVEIDSQEFILKIGLITIIAVNIHDIDSIGYSLPIISQYLFSFRRMNHQGSFRCFPLHKMDELLMQIIDIN